LVEQNSVIYLQQPEYKIGALNICSPAYPSWDLNPILTTHAYIVSYQGAQKIIDFNKKIFVPIDLTWNISRNIILKLTHKITVFQTPVDQDSDVYVSRNSLVRNTIWPNIENPDWGT
jgi:GR25 family glycosyltransferase involved in LPS biosynthesis